MPERRSNLRLLASASVIAMLCAGPRLQAQEPKKVSRAEAMAAVVTKVNPDYPLMARQLKLEGTVEIAIVVDETGNVEQTEAVNGNPVLTRPAATALKKWKFKPFQSDGKPVKAQASIAMTFKM